MPFYNTRSRITKILSNSHTSFSNCERTKVPPSISLEKSPCTLLFRYMLMSPSIQQMRSYTWLKRHLPPTVVLQVWTLPWWMEMKCLGSFCKQTFRNPKKSCKWHVCQKQTPQKYPSTYRMWPRSTPPSASWVPSPEHLWDASPQTQLTPNPSPSLHQGNII